MTEFRVVEGDETPSLALPGMQTITAQEGDNIYLIDVESTQPINYCQKCGTIGQLISFGRLTQEIRDTPVHGKAVRLTVKRRRFRCKACQGTSIEPLEWLHEDRRATKRLVLAVERDALAMPNLHVAHKYGIDDKTVKNILNGFIDREERSLELVTPRWLGIDELHIMGRARGVFTDVGRQRIIELLPERSKQTVMIFLRSLDPQVVEAVTIDMWRPYRDAVREVLPRAAVVVDKFHVVRLANYSLEEVRKKFKAGLDTKQRRRLKRDRFTLLKRRHDLTVFEIGEVSEWAQQFPDLIRAYDLKERLYYVYDATTSTDARRRYKEWKASIPSSLQGSFSDLVRATDNWETEVFAYFDNHRLTNAYTESVNRSTRDVDRAGRGYSFEALRAKVLFGQDARKRPKLASISGVIKIARGNKMMQSRPPFLNMDHIIPISRRGDPVNFDNLMILTAAEHKALTLLLEREKQHAEGSDDGTDQQH